MTTETNTISNPTETTIEAIEPRNTNSRTRMASRLSSPNLSLEEGKGNASKPLSLRPTRSVKKNLSLKPLGLKSR